MKSLLLLKSLLTLVEVAAKLPELLEGLVADLAGVDTRMRGLGGGESGVWGSDLDPIDLGRGRRGGRVTWLVEARELGGEGWKTTAAPRGYGDSHLWSIWVWD